MSITPVQQLAIYASATTEIHALDLLQLQVPMTAIGNANSQTLATNTQDNEYTPEPLQPRQMSEWVSEEYAQNEYRPQTPVIGVQKAIKAASATFQKATSTLVRHKNNLFGPAQVEWHGEIRQGRLNSANVAHHLQKVLRVITFGRFGNIIDYDSEEEQPSWKFASLNFRGPEAFNNKNRTIIDTNEKLIRIFLPTLLKLGRSTPCKPVLGFDGEGGKTYGWHGPLTILQIRHFKLKHTFLFDVKKLGAGMFDVVGEKGQSIRGVLESEEHHKVWWDLRQDQAVLKGQFDITMANVTDLQLVECAVRPRYRENVYGLNSTIRGWALEIMTSSEQERFERKNRQAQRFKNDHGFQALERDEIADIMWEYAAADVHYMDGLCNLFMPRMTTLMKHLVSVETNNRLQQSLSPNMPGGTNIAPASFQQIPVRRVFSDEDIWALPPDQRLGPRTWRGVKRVMPWVKSAE